MIYSSSDARRFCVAHAPLKATGLVGSGIDAKIVVQEGLVKVNGKVCYMRGKKIVSGDIVEFENEKIEVV